MFLELSFEELSSNSSSVHRLTIKVDYLAPPIEGNYSEKLK
jgi:hypothetical protein